MTPHHHPQDSKNQGINTISDIKKSYLKQIKSIAPKLSSLPKINKDKMPSDISKLHHCTCLQTSKIYVPHTLKPQDIGMLQTF